jgi:ribosomal protein S18 acetylase RimI-like enzyme
MSTFVPGRHVRTFTTRAGQEAVIRYPRWEDLDELLALSNRLSQEDTFTVSSGEVISREQQAGYLAEAIKGMELQDYVYLCCFVDGKFAGGCGIQRNLSGMSRKRHMGIFSIALSPAARGQGIGYELARTTIEAARQTLPGLRLLFLEVYEKNIAGINLYKKLGFMEVGRVPQAVLYQGDYIDDIEMTLPLD